MPTALILWHLLIVTAELGVINCTQSLGENVSVLQQEEEQKTFLKTLENTWRQHSRRSSHTVLFIPGIDFLLFV